MSHSYRLGTCKLLSDIELPELMPWEGLAEATDTLHFTLRRSTASIEKGAYVIPGPPKVVIASGTRVAVEPSSHEELVDLRALLMGPIQAILWHQRGLLPLHASAVSIDGKAIAIGGSSGAGKSTLAAVLAAAGNVALADDIAIIDPSSATLLTGQRRLRLWRSAIEHLGLNVDDLPRAMSRSEKFVLKTDTAPSPERHPLAHILLLNPRTAAGLRIEKLHGSNATLALADMVHMLPVAHELGLARAAFQSTVRLQKSGVSVWRLSLPDDLALLHEAAATLLAKLDVQ